MKVATHVVFAEAAWFGCSALFDIDYGVPEVGVVALASVLPDADYPESWLGYQLGDLSRWIHRRAGHRSVLHSLLAVGVLALLLYPLTRLGLTTLYLAALVGYCAHLMADMMTLGGVRLFWPSQVICVFPGRDEYRVISGSGSERVFIILSLACALLLYPVSDRGLSGIVYGIGEGETAYATITAVTDGDTFEAEVLGSAKKIRMIGVDTPETVAPDSPTGCYGPEASSHTKQVLPEGKQVLIETPAVGDSEDVYGRMLAYVYPDPQQTGPTDALNYRLVEAGYGRATTFGHEYQRLYLDAQEAAQDQGRGLWGACEEPEFRN